MSKAISLTLSDENFKEVEKINKKRKFKSISHTINILLEELFEKNFKEGFEIKNKKGVNKNENTKSN